VNPPEFVITLLLIVFAFSLLKRRMDIRHRLEQPGLTNQNSAETLRLREEVKQLKERIQVLERITVDKENSLAKQIEELRDR
jgi:predicted Holliday junction resolvase-like endonuclease